MKIAVKSRLNGVESKFQGLCINKVDIFIKTCFFGDIKMKKLTNKITQNLETYSFKFRRANRANFLLFFLFFNLQHSFITLQYYSVSLFEIYKSL